MHTSSLDHISHLHVCLRCLLHGRAWQILMERMNKWMDEWMFLFISSYWNGHYRMLVIEPYNARVQMGTLISQRSEGSLRKRNGWTHISGQNWTWIQGHWLQTGLFTSLSCVLYCSGVLSRSFYSYVPLYQFPCELPTALHVLVSLMSVRAPMLSSKKPCPKG